MLQPSRFSRGVFGAVAVGLTDVSHSETEAAALQQARKQQRSAGGGGGQRTRLCPTVWLAENTERNKNNFEKKKAQRCLDENKPNRVPSKVRNCLFHLLGEWGDEANATTTMTEISSVALTGASAKLIYFPQVVPSS